jgi:hypothetical protein
VSHAMPVRALASLGAVTTSRSERPRPRDERRGNPSYWRKGWGPADYRSSGEAGRRCRRRLSTTARRLAVVGAVEVAWSFSSVELLRRWSPVKLQQRSG